MINYFLKKRFSWTLLYYVQGFCWQLNMESLALVEESCPVISRSSGISNCYGHVGTHNQYTWKWCYICYTRNFTWTGTCLKLELLFSFISTTFVCATRLKHQIMYMHISRKVRVNPAFRDTHFNAREDGLRFWQNTVRSSAKLSLTYTKMRCL